MNLMPVMFFLFCYNFASALALYWTTQNLISIGQTALIRRLPMPVLSPPKEKVGLFPKDDGAAACGPGRTAAQS